MCYIFAVHPNMNFHFYQYYQYKDAKSYHTFFSCNTFLSRAFCFCFTCNRQNSAIIKHIGRLSASSCDLFHHLNFSYVLKSYLSSKTFFTTERHYMMLQFQEAFVNFLKEASILLETTMSREGTGKKQEPNYFLLIHFCSHQLIAPHFLEPFFAPSDNVTMPYTL